MELVDAAGNRSVTDLTGVACPAYDEATVPTGCDTVYLDRQPPTGFAFSINPTDPAGSFAVGDSHTASPLVELGIDTTLTGSPHDEAVEAIVANDAGFAAGVTQPLATPRRLVAWILEASDGDKTVYVKLRDRAGNLSGEVSDTIVLDTQPPETPIVTPAGSYVSTSTPTLSFAAATGAVAYDLELCDQPNADPPGPCTNLHTVVSDTVDRSYTPATALPEGTYYWRVRAQDEGGHHSPFSPADEFTVDTTAPAAPVLEAVADPVGDSSPTLDWSRVADAALYEVQVDDDAAFATPTTHQSAADSYTLSGLTDDPWNVRVRAVDAAGNPSGWSNEISFTVDTTAPANPTISQPTGGEVVASATVALQHGDMVRLDVKSRDLAGNVTATGRSCITDGASETSLRIDVSAPASPVTTVTVTSDSHTSSATLAFTWSKMEDATSAGEMGYTLQLYRDDGSALPVVQSVAWSTPFAAGSRSASLVAPGDGVYTVGVTPWDAAGNVGPVKMSSQVTVDNEAPTPPRVHAPVGDIAASLPQRLANTRPTFVWSDEASSGATSYELSIYASNAAGAQGGLVGTFSGIASTFYALQAGEALGNGYYLWGVTAVDGAGNTSAMGTVGPALELVSFHQDVTFDDTMMATCALSSDCTVSGNWSTVDLTDSGDAQGPGSSVATSGRYVWSVFKGGQTPDDLRVRRCDMASQCDELADWAASYQVPKSNTGSHMPNSPQLLVTDSYLYLQFWAYLSFGVTYSGVWATRCALSSGCAVDTDWSTPTVSSRILTGNDVTSLHPHFAAGAGALHATWWKDDEDAIRYATCVDPDTVDCTLGTSWRTMTVDTSASLSTRPSVRAFGNNVAIAWMDDSDAMRVALPRVVSPLMLGAAPGIDEISFTWSSLPHYSGYELVYDADGGPLWESSLTLGDPLYDRYALPVADATEYTLAPRSYDGSAEESDASRQVTVRSLTHDTDNTEWVTRYRTEYRAIDGNGTKVALAWAGNSYDGWVDYCDFSEPGIDCTVRSHWNTAEAVDHTSSVYTRGVVVNQDRLYAVFANTVDTVLAWCTLSGTYANDCNEDADWSSKTFLGYEAPSLGVSNGRLFLAVRNGSDQLVMRHCPSDDLGTAGSWTLDVALSADTSTLGHALATAYVGGAQTTVVARATASGTTFIRCDDACGTVEGPVVVDDAVADSDTVGVTLSGDHVPTIVARAGGKLRMGICDVVNSACGATKDSWRFTDLQDLPDEGDGTFVNVLGVSDLRYLLYGYRDRVFLSACKRDCLMPESWVGAQIYRESPFMEPYMNNRIFWVDPGASTFGLAVTLGEGTSGANYERTYVLLDGKLVPR